MADDKNYQSPVGEGFNFESQLADRQFSDRTPEDAEKHSNHFLDGIGIKVRANQLIDEDQRLVRQLMERTVLVAKWYSSNIERGKKHYWNFLVAALVVTISLPFVGYALHIISSAAGTGSSGWPELLVTLIAGLVAAQNLIKAGFENRFRFASFWQARSKIKSAALALRDEWRGKRGLIEPSDNERYALSTEFRKAIRKTIDDATAALEEDQAAFFSNLQFPQIDVAGITSARQAVATLLGESRPASVSAAQAATRTREAALQDRRALERVVASLEREVAESEGALEALLKQLNEAAADDPKKAILDSKQMSLKERLESLNRALNEKAVALASS